MILRFIIATFFLFFLFEKQLKLFIGILQYSTHIISFLEFLDKILNRMILSCGSILRIEFIRLDVRSFHIFLPIRLIEVKIK